MKLFSAGQWPREFHEKNKFSIKVDKKKAME
jgi:hypothetical protein